MIVVAYFDKGKRRRIDEGTGEMKKKKKQNHHFFLTYPNIIHHPHPHPVPRSSRAPRR
jgi:hypothetical protein